jgi:hypothetical protein
MTARFASAPVVDRALARCRRGGRRHRHDVGHFTAAYLELAPRFERASGHTPGDGDDVDGRRHESIPSRLQRREPPTSSSSTTRRFNK